MSWLRGSIERIGLNLKGGGEPPHSMWIVMPRRRIIVWESGLEACASPVSAACGGFEGTACGICDCGRVGVDAEDSEEIDVGGRRELLPGGAAVGRTEDCPVAADEPADLVGVSGTRYEIGDDAARLDEPGCAGIGGALDDAGLTDAPNRRAAGCGNAEGRERYGGDTAASGLGHKFAIRRRGYLRERRGGAATMTESV